MVVVVVVVVVMVGCCGSCLGCSCCGGCCCGCDRGLGSSVINQLSRKLNPFRWIRIYLLGCFYPDLKSAENVFRLTVSKSLQNLNAFIGVTVFESVDSLLVFDHFYKIFFIESMDYMQERIKM